MKNLRLNASEATIIMLVFSELLAILDTVPHKHFHPYSLRTLKTDKMGWDLFYFVVKVKYTYPRYQLFSRALIEIFIRPC